MLRQISMRAETIRFLDYWLGVPACRLLTVIRRLGGRRKPGTRPERILFLKFIEQGATVLAQDAIARAARRVGRDNLYFCVFESNRAILDVLDVVPAANILSIRDKQLVTFTIDFVRALLMMRSRRVDTVIDMEFFSRASAIFAFLSGATTRVGLHRFTGELPYRGDLMTHRVQFMPHVHIAQQYTLLVEAAFLDPVDEPLLKVPLLHIARRSILPRAGTRARCRSRAPEDFLGSAPDRPDQSKRQRSAARKWETVASWICPGAPAAFPRRRSSSRRAVRAPAAEQVPEMGADRAVSVAGKNCCANC